MSTWKICAIILAIGAMFNVAGSYAVEVDCAPVGPHTKAGPVCVEVPHGPRFRVRK